MHSKPVDHTDLRQAALFKMVERWSKPRTFAEETRLREAMPFETIGVPVPMHTRFARKRDAHNAWLIDYDNDVTGLLTQDGHVVFHTSHEDLLATWITDADTSGFGTPPNPGVVADG